MAAHRSDQSLIRMSLLRCLLLLTISAALCQAEAGCEIEENDHQVNISCSEITDFSSVTSVLTSADQKVFKLNFVLSPQLVIQRADLDNPAFQDLERVYWIKSGKTSFDPTPFQGLTKLKRLILRDNKLESITADTFAGLTNLEALSLGNNKIASIAADTLKGLPNLEALVLDINELTSIPSGLFEGSKLEALDLNANELTSIEEGTLRGLDHLKQLDLSFNKIKTIDSRAFQTLAQLEIVDLDGNKLEGLDSRLFANSPLVVLYVQDNDLGNIEQFHFNHTTLTGLMLSGCNIHSLPVNFFNNLPALKALNLRANNLTTIEPGVFTPLTNLHFLNLNRNNLTSLSVSSFDQLQNLAKAVAKNETFTIVGDEIPIELELKHNPWDCSSSDMTELRAWCEQNEIVFDDLFNCNITPTTVPRTEPVA